MGFEIEDERTRGERIARPLDKLREDVSLLVLRGPESGRRFPVKPPGGVMGRQPGCVIQIRDPNISRRHALVEFTADGRVMLTDLGSKSGVYVNGVRVSRAEIYDGNNVQLSNDTVLRVRYQDPAETELLAELHGSNVKDSISGLANRRYLGERLAQELAFARRHSQPLSVVMFDIDDFHKVNEADGRAAGDALIRAMAEVLQKDSRIEDVVTRYGGDQFVVVMRASTAEQSSIYAERVCKQLRTRTFAVGDVPLRISMSVGIASYEPGRFEIDDLQKLLDRADAAVYQAKSEGKDRIEPWIEEYTGDSEMAPESGEPSDPEAEA